MQRYAVNQFDTDTFVVVDKLQNREVCICGNYEGGMDAKIRAHQIAIALNKQINQRSKSVRGSRRFGRTPNKKSHG